MTASRTIICDKHVDLGLADDNGRRIGAAVLAWVDGQVGIAVRVQATRDGVAFGALPKTKRVGTSMAANAEIKRRIDAMVKRYAKKAEMRARGLHATWTDKDTGVKIGMYDSDSGYDPDGAGRYDVVCEAHSTVIGVNTKREGRTLSTLDFCDECREAVRS